METPSYEQLRIHLFEHSYAAHIFRNAIRHKYHLVKARGLSHVIDWCKPHQKQFKTFADQQLAAEQAQVNHKPKDFQWWQEKTYSQLPQGFAEIAKASIPEIILLAEALYFSEDLILKVVANDYLDWSSETPNTPRTITLRRLFPNQNIGRISTAGTYLRVDKWSTWQEIRALLKEMEEDIAYNSKLRENMASVGMTLDKPKTTLRMRNKSVTKADLSNTSIFIRIEELTISHSRSYERKVKQIRQKRIDPVSPTIVSMAISDLVSELCSKELSVKKLGLLPPLTYKGRLDDWLATRISPIYYRIQERYMIPGYVETNNLVSKIVSN